jgi:hypothetical protein
MGLEEHSLEKTGDRCVECGVKLTSQELQTAIESGGPPLCTVHATEHEPGLVVDDPDLGE